jgi:hypothetical protein
MRRKTMLLAFPALLGCLLIGCKSHQAKVSDLQNEYDRLAKQFQRDCSAEYLEVPPKLSPKCKDEDAKMKAAWDRLQAEHAKQ